MISRKSGHATFLDGFRPPAMVISAIGGCLFLCGFFVEGVNGVGRALGLLGIGIALCGIATNLVLQSTVTGLDAQHKHHLAMQIMFTFCLALAVFALAGYLFHYGHLPSFMPARYQEDHVKRLTELQPSSLLHSGNATRC